MKAGNLSCGFNFLLHWVEYCTQLWIAWMCALQQMLCMNTSLCVYMYSSIVCFLYMLRIEYLRFVECGDRNRLNSVSLQ